MVSPYLWAEPQAASAVTRVAEVVANVAVVAVAAADRAAVAVIADRSNYTKGCAWRGPSVFISYHRSR